VAFSPGWSRELPVEHVEDDIDAGVADVAEIVGRDAADVHAVGIGIGIGS